MAYTIDDLEIEIQAESNKAGNAIEKLATSLEKLKTACAGATAPLTQLRDALSGLGSVQTSMGKVATSLKSISGSTDHLKNATATINDTSNALRDMTDMMRLDGVDFSAAEDGAKKVANAVDGIGKTASGKSGASVLSFLDNLAHKANIARARFIGLNFVIGGISALIAKSVNEINDYVETVNLFQVSMGEYYDEAFEYAQLVSEKLGIDPAQWMKAQGVFMSMAKGFGVTEKQAYELSEGLTELSYDISSLYNEDTQRSIERLQSALAGEIEPIRRLGVSISAATLQEYALSKGITESVNAMTEQEKALLRSMVLIERSNAIGAVGDFTKTLESPANALRVLQQQFTQLSRAIGSVFLPILVQVIPWVQAITSVLTGLISALARLVGFTMPTWDKESWNNLVSGAKNADKALTGAGGAAKKLKEYTMGIDELNVINPDTGGGGGGGGGISSDWASQLEIPNLWDEEMIAAIETKAQKIEKFLKPILKVAGLIGAAFAAWKIGQKLIDGLEKVDSLIESIGSADGSLRLIGMVNLFADISELKRYIDDIFENGANFSNVTGAIAELAGVFGDVAIALGNTQIGAALKVTQGLGEIFSSLADISEKGMNIDNVLTFVRGLSNIFLALGLMKKNKTIIGAMTMIQGITAIVRELHENWDAIKQGDWSGVDKIVLIIGAVQIFGGLATALGAFGKIVGGAGLGDAKKSIGDLSSATSTIDNTVKDNLSPSLKSLAKNLGFGVLVILEVSAVAVILAGTIAIMGKELKAIGTAWDDITENGDSIISGLVLGTAALAGIGFATYGLGTIGKTIAPNMAIGALVLAEIGVATGLFLVEIWAVGKALDEIGIAWEPVLENGETVSKAMVIGTGVLVAIGAACAALGTITVGTAGTIPIAIAVGAGVLAEMSGATVLLIKELTVVSDTLSEELAPALEELNGKLPNMSSYMSDFTDFLGEFAGEVANYADAAGNIGWSQIVMSFQSIFTGNPLKSIAKDIKKVGEDAVSLSSELEIANPELEKATLLMSDYTELMTELGLLSQSGGNLKLQTDIYTNLKECGEKLVTGFNDGMKSKVSTIQVTIRDMKTTIMSGFEEMGSAVVEQWKGTMSELETSVSNFSTNSLTHFKTFQTESQKGMNSFTEAFPKHWAPMWDGLSRTTLIGWNSILTTLELGINRAVDAMNSVIASINSMADKTGISVDPMNRVDIPLFETYASGGFPTHGQMFLARESGPELVGSIGRKTAVANNNQIVDGIAQGVYSAMTEAMSDTNSGPAEVQASFNIYLSGKQIAAEVEKVNKQRGVKIMNGGAY